MLITTTLLAGGLALVLLVIIYWRTAQRYEALKADVDRMQVVQRDMTTDVRSRLEEGARGWDRVESELTPRLDRLEPSLADLSATLDENLPALTEARARLEKLEAEFEAVEADLRSAHASGAQEAIERAGRIEAAVRTLRNAADERLADLSARITALEPEPAPEADEQEEERAAEGADVAWVDAHPASDEVALVVSSADGDAPSGAGRGTPPARRAGWVVVVLALVAGLALVIAAWS